MMSEETAEVITGIVKDAVAIMTARRGNLPEPRTDATDTELKMVFMWLLEEALDHLDRIGEPGKLEGARLLHAAGMAASIGLCQSPACPRAPEVHVRMDNCPREGG